MTAQIHEKLIYNGTHHSMAFCPALPEDHPRIVDRPDPEDAGVLMSTACWRGYQGTWEIKDDHFFLINIDGCYELKGPDPLHALWFSGVIRVPVGEVLHYVHMGFESVYEQEIHVKFVDGLVVEIQNKDNRGKNPDSFE
jgi:hypothetical protein